MNNHYPSPIKAMKNQLMDPKGLLLYRRLLGD